jgi:hypothetical protein
LNKGKRDLAIPSFYVGGEVAVMAVHLKQVQENKSHKVEKHFGLLLLGPRHVMGLDRRF